MKSIDDLLIKVLDEEMLIKCLNTEAIQKVISEGIENAIFLAFENNDISDEIYNHINEFMIQFIKRALPLKEKKKNARSRAK
jgi:hypothetical protein